ncbi:MAG: hypothetical protein ACOCYO_01420 [Bacteroidota bacterium]
MRKFFLINLVLFFALTVSAQDCSFYIPLEEGKGFQYENYNKKDKFQSKNDIEIVAVGKVTNGTEAIMAAKSYDKKDKLLFEGEYGIICTGNELLIDMQSLINPAMMEGFSDMEVSISSMDIVIPENPKVGDKLPDAEMEITVSTGGMTISEMVISMKNRVVEARETITTPAGTFDCIKLTYENHMDTKAMGISRNVVTKVSEYYAPEVGNVKSEFFDQKGNLDSYNLLVEIY